MTTETTPQVTFGVTTQTSEHEARVALTPDIVTRLGKKSVSCLIESGAGLKAGFSDEQYAAAGAKICTRDEVLKGSNALGFIERPQADLLDAILPGTWVIGMLSSFSDSEYIDDLARRGIVGIAMERLPRQLSSAQSMDAMTSQNSVMGYKAALRAADAYGGFFPMMTTAAGTIRPAKVLILGAGIAGLQAIGTARRLGAVVTAYDVRPASREEVESLGASFLDLEVDLSAGQGEGGYARELSAEERAAQQAAVDAKAADFDVIITTAKVPGRKPPVLLTSAGIEGLHRGAVVLDCAASDLGGNVEGSVPFETVTTARGVRIMGEPALASEVPATASNLFARNVADILVHFIGESGLSVTSGEELDDALVVTGAGAGDTASVATATAVSNTAVSDTAATEERTEQQ